MKIVTPAQMKEIDRTAIEGFGVPGMELMERAGTRVAERVKKVLAGSGPSPLAVVVAGKGNNGGDALVAAGVLHQEGIKTDTFLLASPGELAGDAAACFSRLNKARVPIRPLRVDGDLGGLKESLDRAAVVVDGIFGTGFSGTVRGLSARVIEMINEARTAVVAIDIPSGLNGETGAVEGPAVRAGWTVTMGLPKTGLVRGEGLDYSGRIEVADIGFPHVVIEPAASDLELITPVDLAPLLPPRRRSAHKGDFGHLLVLAGSQGFTGAAALCAAGGLRGGAGLVTVGVPESLYPILASKCTEAMTLPLPETPPGALSPEAAEPVLEFCRRATAVALGPGLSQNDLTGELVRKLVETCPLPMVIDADGLNLISRDISVLSRAKSPLILTPHPGEMARLSGLKKDELFKNREKAARAFSGEYNVTLVLKGAGTLVAPPGGTPWINLAGNPGMASGGTGDVLTGLIGAFLAQGLPPAAAARLGVFVHGAAGDRAVEKVGQISLIASDLLAEVPAVLKDIFAWSTHG